MEIAVNVKTEPVHLETVSAISEEESPFCEPYEKIHTTRNKKISPKIAKSSETKEISTLKPPAHRCDFCKEVSKNSSRHKAHMKSHIRYKCCECQQLFVSMSTLTRHAAVHNAATGARTTLTNSCPTCGKSFSCPGHLRVHELIHREDKQFICEYCSFESATESNLKKHLRRHNNEKPFECDLCKKTFKVLGNLRVHMERHIRERNYLCMICGKSYITKSNLNGHMLTHTNEKKHVCLQCMPNRRFARGADLTRHRRALHTFASQPFDFYK